MANDEASRHQAAEMFRLTPPESMDKNAFSASGTSLNTSEGSSIIKDANKAKQVPSAFKGKDGSDIQLLH